MDAFEKLGVFYLGRRYDLGRKQAGEELLLYDSKDLVTHALIVGMTGSGKTGLCVDVIEEAAIDGIPSVIIDPKGDLSNLLLTFPDLRPEDFAPWVNEDDARKKGLSVSEFAAQQAELWRNGLAKWGQDGERIRRLKDSAEFAIYTPGSSAGLPISILKRFAAPPEELANDTELAAERASSTVAGLLGLLQIGADPVKSREMILLTTLLQNAWAEGRTLDLAGLIHQIQQPPIQRAGVLDLDTFFPPKDRFDLAIQLNNLLASPKFAAWMTGEPLDVGRLLFASTGKPRVAIFSLAHLADSERMFFVTLLLNEVLAWMRTQSGTSSLRALVYMDEIFGYFPPVANPPSKLPLLTLLKQARAHGVGVVLATQNPVDLDYRGLANIGTWCIGRLQTERDKARVLEGLEGAAAGRGASFDRRAIEQTLAGLGSRVFLLRNVHEDEFDLFESRWAMSYLRGPLSRAEIKALMEDRELAVERPAQSSIVASLSPERPAAETADRPDPAQSHLRPALAPGIQEFFVPLRDSPGTKGSWVYQPRVIAAAQVRFVDARNRVDEKQDILAAAEITQRAIPVDWATAEEVPIELNDLETAPDEGAAFAACPAAAAQPKSYEKWGKDFAAWLYANRKLTLFRSPALDLTSRPGESEREFRVRLQQAAHEQRDAAVEKLRQKYAPKLAAVQERLRRAEAAREREAEQAKRAKLDTVISFGSTLLGAFLGRKKLSAGTLGKAATTFRGVTRSLDQAGDVNRAAETVESIQQALADLDAQFRSESEALARSFESSANELETLELRLSKSNIQVKLVALGWVPT